MKNLLKFTLGLICAKYNWIKYRIIYPGNSINIRGLIGGISCKVRGSRNTINIQSSCRKLQIYIEGSDNNISIVSHEMSNVSFEIFGSEHECNFYNVRVVRNSRFVQLGEKSKIIVGEDCGIGGLKCVVKGEGNCVQIGARSMLADNVQIWASDSHPIYDAATQMRLNPDGSVFIGDGVWIGTGVFIMKNTRIENGAVVGAASVVTKNVSAKSMVVGSPIRQIKNNVTWRIFE